MSKQKQTPSQAVELDSWVWVGPESRGGSAGRPLASGRGVTEEAEHLGACALT